MYVRVRHVLVEGSERINGIPYCRHLGPSAAPPCGITRASGGGPGSRRPPAPRTWATTRRCSGQLLLSVSVSGVGMYTLDDDDDDDDDDDMVAVTLVTIIVEVAICF